MSSYKVRMKDDNAGIFIGTAVLVVADKETEQYANLYDTVGALGEDTRSEHFDNLPVGFNKVPGIDISKNISVISLNNQYGEQTYHINYQAMSAHFSGIVFSEDSPYALGNNISYWFDEHKNIKITFRTTTPFDPTIIYRRDDNILLSMSGGSGNGQYMTIPWYNTHFDKLAHWRLSSWTAIVPDSSPVQFYMKGVTLPAGQQIPVLTNLSNEMKAWFGALVPIDEDNPYSGGGESGTSDSEGNFSSDSDTVDLDNLPVLNAVGTGFATLFTPTKAQLSYLASVMWNGTIFTALQNLVENITNMFTGLSIVPFVVDKGPTVEVTWFDWAITEIDLDLAAEQFYEIPMGSINLANDPRIFTSGSALDYAPFSKLGIYLPFIGFQELDIDECRGCTMSLDYRIDILSGTAVAIISLNGNAVYQYTGNCLTQIPVTSESLESLVSDAVNVGIAISNTGATAATAAGELQEASHADGGLKFDDITNAHRKITTSEGQLASATANAAMGMKPNIKKSGAVSAAASLLSVRQPYLFLTTPNQSMPAHYQRYCGFPSNITGKLSEFSGYTVVESIRLNGLVATTPEVAEIYDLLKKGVII